MIIEYKYKNNKRCRVQLYVDEDMQMWLPEEAYLERGKKPISFNTKEEIELFLDEELI